LFLDRDKPKWKPIWAAMAGAKKPKRACNATEEATFEKNTNSIVAESPPLPADTRRSTVCGDRASVELMKAQLRAHEALEATAKAEAALQVMSVKFDVQSEKMKLQAQQIDDLSAQLRAAHAMAGTAQQQLQAQQAQHSMMPQQMPGMMQQQMPGMMHQQQYQPDMFMQQRIQQQVQAAMIQQQMQQQIQIQQQMQQNM
jgi:hypothetical protein